MSQNACSAQPLYILNQKANVRLLVNAEWALAPLHFFDKKYLSAWRNPLGEQVVLKEQGFVIALLMKLDDTYSTKTFNREQNVGQEV